MLNFTGDLQRHTNALEYSSILTMYSNMVILGVGLIGNVFTFIVLVYSKKKKSHIVASNYLILLTAANTCYLLSHFNTDSYNRIIYHFNINNIQLLHSNQLACKGFYYLKHCARYINTMLTVCFSLERLLAVYYPLKIRSLHSKFSVLFKLSIFIACLIPLYFPLYVELVSKSDMRARNLYLIKKYNYHLPDSPVGNFTCTTGMKHFATKTTFDIITLILSLILYIFVSLTLIAIVLKLKTSRKSAYMVRFSINRTSTLLSNSESMSLNRQASQHDQEHQVYRPEVKIRMNQSKIVNRKLQDIKMLISLSLSFIVFNTPYYFIMVYMLFFLRRSSSSMIEKDLLFKLQIFSYMNIGDIFQLVNFSLSGILLLITGRTFRLYAYNCFKNCFNC